VSEMKLLILVLIVWVAIGVNLEARTWTSEDGTALEAEFVSATETAVTIQRDADRRRFTIPLEKLSAADREWVAAQGEAEGDSEISLPKDVATLVAERGTLLFEDRFDREDADEVDDLGEAWETNSKSRAQGDKQTDLVEGAMVITISPRADHGVSVVHHTAETYQDAVTYVKMKLEEGESLKLAFNDRDFKEVHAGHINGTTISPTRVTLGDEREGRFSAKATVLKEDPSKKEELTALTKAFERSFDLDLETGEWHDVVVVHDGGVMTVWIDGDEVGSYESPGFGHETKRQFAFAVPKRATVDDLRIWKLGAAGE
jgi:hypothetical protein